MENDRTSDFFMVAFIFSWILWIPVAMISAGFSFPQPIEAFLMSPYNPAAFGPTLAAVLLTYRYGGRMNLWHSSEGVLSTTFTGSGGRSSSSSSH